MDMLTWKYQKRCTAFCLIALVFVAVASGPVNVAFADLNIVGSTHGQNYQGVTNPNAVVGPPPVPAGAAYAVPLALCDPPSSGAPTPNRYTNAANLSDPLQPGVVMPANTSIVWVCTLNGVPNFTFRYTGGFSAFAYNAIKQPLTSTGSQFTSIVPGGTGCTAVAGNPQTDPGTGLKYNSFQSCTQLASPPFNANFATSDTKGTNFAATMCDQTGACAAPILDTGVQSFPITATPFVMIVGNGVQKCNPTDNSANGKITLTRSQVEAIFSGQVSSWNQLGYCVYPATDTDGDGFPNLDPIGTVFNASVDQLVVTCSRPITAGTRIIFDSIVMRDAAQLTYGIVAGGTPFVPFEGDHNYLAPTVMDGLTCVQGRTTPSPTSTANPNAISYNRADEASNSTDFGAGNVGKMNGGYPVPLDGDLPSNYVKPGNIQAPTATERATSQKDFRCGRYSFWSDWVGIQRTSPVDANQALWTQYVNLIAQNLSLTPAGFFWAEDLRQPGNPVVSEMSIQKGPVKGPTQYNPGFNTACR
ncbi:MAG TPA: hypothetical protein VEI50_08505 [Nitrospiraceae bacterium]|nr:hypothetical protein [Nitrospiraceae bacterium]